MFEALGTPPVRRARREPLSLRRVHDRISLADGDDLLLLRRPPALPAG